MIPTKNRYKYRRPWFADMPENNLSGSRLSAGMAGSCLSAGMAGNHLSGSWIDDIKNVDPNTTPPAPVEEGLLERTDFLIKNVYWLAGGVALLVIILKVKGKI